MGCTLGTLWGQLSEAVAPLPLAGTVCGQRWRAVRLLGEGGYAYVHLVRASGSGPEAGAERALKRVLCQGEEALQLARREVETLRRVRHPAVVRLLGAEEADEGVSGREPRVSVLMLFPYHDEGTLLERVPAAGALGAADVAGVLRDACAGVAALHRLEGGGLCHRDVKPANLLLCRREGGRLGCVLCDLGSAVPLVRRVGSRREAVALQEEAEQYSSAPFRAPELWDCPSDAAVGGEVDAWALGCTLYFAMYGVTPFEYQLGGGSLSLAVLTGEVRWPPAPATPYPEALHAAVLAAVARDPAARPSAEELGRAIEAAAARLTPGEERMGTPGRI